MEMVNEEELEVLKMIGDKCKLKDLWLKVYDDELKKDGLISVFEIIKSVLDGMEKNKKQEGKNEHGRRKN